VLQKSRRLPVPKSSQLLTCGGKDFEMDWLERWKKNRGNPWSFGELMGDAYLGPEKEFREKSQNREKTESSGRGALYNERG